MSQVGRSSIVEVCHRPLSQRGNSLVELQNVGHASQGQRQQDDGSSSPVSKIAAGCWKRPLDQAEGTIASASYCGHPSRAGPALQAGVWLLVTCWSCGKANEWALGWLCGCGFWGPHVESTTKAEITFPFASLLKTGKKTHLETRHAGSRASFWGLFG
jgi:hypothetical protein